MKKTNQNKYIIRKLNKDNIIEKRYNILKIIIIIIFIILFIRLFYIQVINNKYYKKKLKELTTKIVESESTPRGRIYDRNGNIIVDNISNKVIYYKKSKNITTEEEIDLAYQVALLIDIDYSEVTETMLREFWVLNNPESANKKIKEKEWENLKLRKLTKKNIEKLKKERVTLDELDVYREIDKKACYIYNLMNRGYYYTEKVIKDKDVTDKEFSIIGENINKLKGFNVKLDWNRYYPYGEVFKTILGSVSTSESGIPYNLKDKYLKKGYSLTDRVGTSYIEYQYEKYLKGKKAKYLVNNDASYTELEKGSRGNDIVLTIDINLQKEVEKIVEEELILAKKERHTEYFNKAYVIINDPKTGEILTMVGKQININEDGSYSIYDYTPGIITASVTPGSIVKGASHIVGYNTGALKIGEVRYDTCIKIASTPKKCSYMEYGSIDDLKALKYSSNVYQFFTAINVGKGVYGYNMPLVIDENAFDTYRNTFKEFGLGIKTGIDLPNESLGYKGKEKIPGLLLDFAIGQYDTYTPIQINQYMSTIANDGVRMQPYLLKAVFKNDLDNVIYETKSKILNKVSTDKIYMDRVHEGFKQVMEYGGTGSGYIAHEYKPAGKTGTSQSYIDTNGDGVIDVETITSTFSGYAPYDNPKVVFTVISPDISPGDIPYVNATHVNTRISKKVSQKYFEIYK